MTKKIPSIPTPDPEETLRLLGIPVLGSIGGNDEAMGFKSKKKVTRNCVRTSSDDSGGKQSSENTEQKK
jgi:hypothetical protein